MIQPFSRRGERLVHALFFNRTVKRIEEDPHVLFTDRIGQPQSVRDRVDHVGFIPVGRLEPHQDPEALGIAGDLAQPLGRALELFPGRRFSGALAERGVDDAAVERGAQLVHPPYQLLHVVDRFPPLLGFARQELLVHRQRAAPHEAEAELLRPFPDEPRGGQIQSAHIDVHGIEPVAPQDVHEVEIVRGQLLREDVLMYADSHGEPACYGSSL